MDSKLTLFGQTELLEMKENQLVINWVNSLAENSKRAYNNALFDAVNHSLGHGGFFSHALGHPYLSQHGGLYWAAVTGGDGGVKRCYFNRPN